MTAGKAGKVGNALLLAGTGSDVGKSLLAAGLCRAYTNRGLTVRPFKPQNMSNNAAVTEDSGEMGKMGEIGRAQALQARACRTPPTVDMNPILLKPQTDTGAQLIVRGQRHGNVKARDYQQLKPRLLDTVLGSFARLSASADLVIVEGAGSISEINLRAGDIANMGFAEASQTPVVVVGDIDRGGVIAALVGSHALLTASERELLKGFIINKFRGDLSLFDSAIEIISERTGLQSFGIVPFFPAAGRLPAEDAVGIVSRSQPQPNASIRIAVPLLTRIANFDDLDPLLAEPDVAVEFIESGRALPGNADLIILAGSKATRADLALVREQGWDIDIQAHLRRGGWLLGLCGGYQMLGQNITDSLGIEGIPGSSEGLGYLAIDTALQSTKTLTRSNGIALPGRQPVYGYQIHSGIDQGDGLARPMLLLEGRADGAISPDGRIAGCYLHGLFNADEFRHAYLHSIREREQSGLAFEQQIESTLDALAAHLTEHLDLDALLDIIGE